MHGSMSSVVSGTGAEPKKMEGSSSGWSEGVEAEKEEEEEMEEDEEDEEMEEEEDSFVRGDSGVSPSLSAAEESCAERTVRRKYSCSAEMGMASTSCTVSGMHGGSRLLSGGAEADVDDMIEERF